jgi:hypothetical protein
MSAAVSSGPAVETRGELWTPWQAVALTAVVAMEISWATPWVRALNAAIYAVPVIQMLAVAGLIGGLAAWAERTLAYLRLNLTARRAVLLAALLIGLWLGNTWMVAPGGPESLAALKDTAAGGIGEVIGLIPSRLWISLAVIAIWWRGIRLGRERFGPITVGASFRLGALMFIAFAVSGLLVPLIRKQALLIPIFSFLFFGSLALITARISSISLLRGGSASPFDRRWLGSIAVVLFVVVGGAAGMAAVASGQAQLLLAIVADLAVLVGAIAAAPVLLLLSLLAPGTEAIRQALPTPTPDPGLPPWEAETGSEPGLGFRMLEQSTNPLSPETRALLTEAVVILGLAILIAALLLSLRWALRNPGKGRAQDTEPILEAESLASAVRRAVRQGVQKIITGLPGGGKLRPPERLQAAARIRQIFIALLDLAEQNGAPRQPYQTPLEFSGGLQGRYPALSAELETITQAYVRIRYGELPETVQEVAQVETAWRRLQTEAPALPLAGEG